MFGDPGEAVGLEGCPRLEREERVLPEHDFLSVSEAGPVGLRDGVEGPGVDELTVRDEARWYESVSATIYPVTFVLPRWLQWLVPPIARLNKMIVATVWDGEFGGRFEDREHALKIYRDHIKHVQATARRDQLLVFEARDGWAPLCSFLNVPVPENDFPHLNDAAQIRRGILAIRALGWLSLAGLLGGLGSLLIYALG